MKPGKIVKPQDEITKPINLTAAQREEQGRPAPFPSLPPRRKLALFVFGTMALSIFLTSAFVWWLVGKVWGN